MATKTAIKRLAGDSESLSWHAFRARRKTDKDYITFLTAVLWAIVRDNGGTIELNDRQLRELSNDMDGNRVGFAINTEPNEFTMTIRETGQFEI